jgi:similar to stage IV sporulation protein
MVGAVLAWAILFLSSLTIWEVRVSERSGEDPQKICRLLEECGLELGTFLPTLNVRAVENQFLLNNPQYSFLAVNVYGTVANIEIRRASQKGETEDKEKQCHVVAKREGTIISVEAYGGSPAVKKGDKVSAGDMLISSFMEGSFGVVRSVHAYGKVMAEVNYEYVTEIPLEVETIFLTGKETAKTSVRLLCFQADLFTDEKSPYNKNQIVSTVDRIELFGIKLPIEVQKAVYLEEKSFKKTISEKEAELKALKDYEMYKEREIKGEIISESFETVLDKEKGVLKLKSNFCVIEDIGEKIYIE